MGEPTFYGAFEDLPPSTIVCILFFGSIIFVTIGMAAKAFLTEDTRGAYYDLNLPLYL